MDIVSQAIAVLVELGWVQIGTQPIKSFRTHTGGSPVPNATITTGGRHKLEKPGSQRRVTVGKRTACFFTYDGKDCKDFLSVSTKNLDEIKRLGKVCTEEITAAQSMIR